MASPPFIPNTAIPGDTDIISQFPAVDRTHIDIFNSWLLVEHDTNGKHTQVSMPWQTDLSGTASQTRVWASSTGNAAGELKKILSNTGSVEYVGNPPGTIVAYAGSSLPAGWYYCNGLTASRTTDARLFDAIGTTYGIGDGTTTFNLPDLQERILVGQSGLGGASSPSRVTTAGSGVDGTTRGASGGAQAVTIAQANLPNVAFTVSGIALSDLGHNTTGLQTVNVGSGAGSNALQAGGGGHVGPDTTGITIASQGTAASGGSGTALGTMPPSIVIPYIIKR